MCVVVVNQQDEKIRGADKCVYERIFCGVREVVRVESTYLLVSRHPFLEIPFQFGGFSSECIKVLHGCGVVVVVFCNGRKCTCNSSSSSTNAAALTNQRGRWNCVFDTETVCGQMVVVVVVLVAAAAAAVVVCFCFADSETPLQCVLAFLLSFFLSPSALVTRVYCANTSNDNPLFLVVVCHTPTCSSKPTDGKTCAHTEARRRMLLQIHVIFHIQIVDNGYTQTRTPFLDSIFKR